MIRLGIIGYGNIGRACERIAARDDRFRLAGIFTRRDPSALGSPFGTKFYRQSEIFSFSDDIDVALVCTGSANDVENLTPRLAKRFNTVDSFDTHAKMKDYISAVNEAALRGGKLCFVGIGWDPGLFSMARALFYAVLEGASVQTFWGRGVSQGHSEAIRRIDGVLDARQYTVPIPEAVAAAKRGEADALSDRQKHRRECYVVAAEGVDLDRIKREIVEMPNYFAPYDTSVQFVSREQLETEHRGMPHAGKVIACGREGGDSLNFALSTTSNPDMTAGIMMAYARANAHLYAENCRGAYTICDIPVSALYDADDKKSARDFV